MEDGRITNSQIKTSPRSSTYRDSPRLNNVRYFIASITWFPFIQVDFGPSRKRITAIAAQGGHRSYNTWTYYVKYMDDEDDWFNYAENGVARVSCKTWSLISRNHFKRLYNERCFDQAWSVAGILRNKIGRNNLYIVYIVQALIITAMSFYLLVDIPSLSAVSVELRWNSDGSSQWQKTQKTP